MPITASRLLNRAMSFVTLIAAVMGLLVFIAMACAGIWLVGYVIVGPFIGG